MANKEIVIDVVSEYSDHESSGLQGRMQRKHHERWTSLERSVQSQN